MVIRGSLSARGSYLDDELYVGSGVFWGTRGLIAGLHTPPFHVGGGGFGMKARKIKSGVINIPSGLVMQVGR